MDAIDEDDEKRAFLNACSGGHMDAVLWFTFCRRLDPFEQDSQRGVNGIIAAAKAGHADIVCVLALELCQTAYHVMLESGSSHTDDGTTGGISSSGTTSPRAKSVQLDWKDMSKILEPGLRIKDKMGRTALDWAATFGHTHCMALLMDICPPVMRTWKQRHLFAAREVKQRMHVETAALLVHKQMQDGLPHGETSPSSSPLATVAASAALQEPFPNFSIQCLFSGNRWMSSRMPYLTLTSFLIASCMTFYMVYVNATNKNCAALLIQALLYVLIWHIRKTDPGYVVPIVLGEQSRIEYHAALWRFYEHTKNRAMYLAQMNNRNTDANSNRNGNGNENTVNTSRMSDTVVHAITSGMMGSGGSGSDGVKCSGSSSGSGAVSSRSFCCYICQCSRETRQKLRVTGTRTGTGKINTIEAGSGLLPASSVTATATTTSDIGHSKQTHRCVHRFDHSCVFLGVDVGLGNYRAYMITLAMCVCLAFPVFLSCTTEYIHWYHEKAKAIDTVSIDTGTGTSTDTTTIMVASTPLLLRAFLVWTLLMWMQMASLLVVHLYCSLWLNVTSREMFFNGKRKHASIQAAAAVAATKMGVGKKGKKN